MADTRPTYLGKRFALISPTDSSRAFDAAMLDIVRAWSIHGPMTMEKMRVAAWSARHFLSKKRSVLRGTGFYVVRVTEKEADAGKAPSGFYIMHKYKEGRHRLYGPYASLALAMRNIAKEGL